tara:strand:- start:1742 stop:1927 length:186 start_codon:yes stop_codon:yes gene_type:complete
MNKDYSLEEDTQTKYTFTWVNSDFEIFINVIFADSETEATIKFFKQIEFDDIKNYEIDLEE